MGTHKIELAALLGLHLTTYVTTVHLALKWLLGVRLGVEAALFVSSMEEMNADHLERARNRSFESRCLLECWKL